MVAEAQAYLAKEVPGVQAWVAVIMLVGLATPTAMIVGGLLVVTRGTGASVVRVAAWTTLLAVLVHPFVSARPRSPATDEYAVAFWTGFLNAAVGNAIIGGILYAVILLLMRAPKRPPRVAAIDTPKLAS